MVEKNGDKIPVPCGKCPHCVARRVSNWSFRLVQEGKRSVSSSFVTLTYDTKHVPLSPALYMSLSKRDVQLFFKRLRKANVNKLKYFAVGEYGAENWRPHYHIILYNADITTISPAWDKGDVHYGNVSEASIGYCLKYISKIKKIPIHQNDDRVPEFALMSKRLGDNYLSPDMIKWHLQDIENRCYVNIVGGKKAAMPRYYKDKIYSEFQRDLVANAGRQRAFERNYKDFLRKIEIHGSEELALKAIDESNVELFKKMYASHSKNKYL